MRIYIARDLTWGSPIPNVVMLEPTVCKLHFRHTVTIPVCRSSSPFIRNTVPLFLVNARAAIKGYISGPGRCGKCFLGPFNLHLSSHLAITLWHPKTDFRKYDQRRCLCPFFTTIGVASTAPFIFIFSVRNLVEQRWKLCVGAARSLPHIHMAMHKRQFGIGMWGMHCVITNTGQFSARLMCRSVRIGGTDERGKEAVVYERFSIMW